MKAILILFGLLSLGFFTAIQASDCTSVTCADCNQDTKGIASCTSVSYDASCSCTISVSYPDFCVLDGTCNYSPAGGGGGGGDGGGDGQVCYRLAGSWCPPECRSCETVYWY